MADQPHQLRFFRDSNRINVLTLMIKGVTSNELLIVATIMALLVSILVPDALVQRNQNRRFSDNKGTPRSNLKRRISGLATGPLEKNELFKSPSCLIILKG